MDSMQVAPWSGGASIAGSGQSLSTSSSVKSYVSFKNLKDAWEVKSTSSSSKGSLTTPRRGNRGGQYSHPTSTTKSGASFCSAIDLQGVQKRAYPNNLYGQKRGQDSPSFDTTASSTASSSFPKSNSHHHGHGRGGGSGHKHKGGGRRKSRSKDRVKTKRGELAQKFDQAVDISKWKVRADRSNSVDRNEAHFSRTISNSNRGTGIIQEDEALNVTPSHTKSQNHNSEISQLQNDVRELMMDNPSMVHSLSANLGPCHLCNNKSHPTLRCNYLSEENIPREVQQKLEIWKKGLEKNLSQREREHSLEGQSNMHQPDMNAPLIENNEASAADGNTSKEPTLPQNEMVNPSMGDSLVPHSEVVTGASQRLSAQNLSKLQGPGAASATAQSTSSAGPTTITSTAITHLLASHPQSISSPPPSSPPPDAKQQQQQQQQLQQQQFKFDENDLIVNSQQQADGPKELNAFLTSPTGMNWEDLVRSFKTRRDSISGKDPHELLLNKTITVVEDDVSELGSMIDGRGNDNRFSSYLGDRGESDGAILGDHGYGEPPNGDGYKGFVGDLDTMGDVLKSILLRDQQQQRDLPPMVGEVVVMHHGEEDVGLRSDGDDSSISSKSTFGQRRRVTPQHHYTRGHEHQQAVDSSRDVSVSIGNKLEAPFPAQGRELEASSAQRHHSEPLPPSRFVSLRSSKNEPKSLLRIGSSSSAFSPIKFSSQQLKPTAPNAMISPTTPGTAMETMLNSSFELSEITPCSHEGDVSPTAALERKRSSSGASFSPIEPCVSPNHSLCHPNPISPRVSRATSMSRTRSRNRVATRGSPERKSRKGASLGRGSDRSSSKEDMHVGPKRIWQRAECSQAEMNQGRQKGPDNQDKIKIDSDGESSSPLCHDRPIVKNIPTDDTPGSPEGDLLQAALDSLDKSANDVVPTGKVISNNDSSAKIIEANDTAETLAIRTQRLKSFLSNLQPSVHMSTTDGEDDSKMGEHLIDVVDGKNIDNEVEMVKGESVQRDLDRHSHQMPHLLSEADEEDEVDGNEAENGNAAKAPQSRSQGAPADTGDEYGSGEMHNNIDKIASSNDSGSGNLDKNAQYRGISNFPVNLKDAQGSTRTRTVNRAKTNKEHGPLQAGFNAVAAAAAAKQRVEQQERQSEQQLVSSNATATVVRNSAGSRKRSSAISALTDATSAHAATSACTTITSALCAGLWNGGHDDEDPHATASSSVPLRATLVESGRGEGAASTSVHILPESLVINPKAPSCRQMFWHRLRKTKGEF